MSSIEVLWNEVVAVEALNETSPTLEEDTNIQSSSSPSSSFNLDELGQRVKEASDNDKIMEQSIQPDDAINRIKTATSISQNNPQPMPKDINMQSPEYMFGEAFTNLVRHIVIDYLDKSVEPIIREAITSEIKQISKKSTLKK